LTFHHNNISYPIKKSAFDVDAALEIEEIRNQGFQVRVCQPGEEKSLLPGECDLSVTFFSGE